MRVDPLHLLIMTLAVVVGMLVRRLVAQPTGLSRRQRISVALAAIIGGAIGAKLPFLFLDASALGSLASWTSDGRTITWGMAGGYLAVEGAKLALGLRVKTGDSFAAPVAAAVAVGRIGCFQGGCCYGAATTLPWAVNFGDGIMRHPTQIYESAFHALAAVSLVGLNRSGLLPRQHFKLYLGSYCIYRFVTEWIRPEPAWLGPFTFYQVSVVVIFAMVVIHFILDQRAEA